VKQYYRIIFSAFAFIAVSICVCTAIFAYSSNNLSAQTNNQTVTSVINKSLITSYEQMKNGHIKDNLGNEYAEFTMEGFITSLGTPKFVAPIKGDSKESSIWSQIFIKCGVYSLENDKDLVTIMRISPDSEWQIYYRRVGAPKITLNYGKCSRFEFIGYKETSKSTFYTPSAQHAFCNDGITNKFDVNRFILSMKLAIPVELTGYKDKLRDRTYEECYEYGKVYGYFKGENSFAMEFVVWSYDDKKFTIDINDKSSVVLSESWLKQLQAKH